MSQCSVSSNEEFQQIFYKELIEFDKMQLGNRRKPWTMERLGGIINDLKSDKDPINSGQKRTPMMYYWRSKYETMTIDGEDHLFLKRKPPHLPIRIVPREQYFEVLLTIHDACDHGGRDKMLQHLKNDYYIPKRAVEIFVHYCPRCSHKRKLPKEEAVCQENVVQMFNISAQVDLIDFQSRPDGEFNWILYYQDNATKFTSLRPLRSNAASEVSSELIKIFLTFGAPSVLEMDIGHQFAARIIEELKAMWPDCTVCHKNPEIKESNHKIKQMLLYWMLENNSNKWSVGCFIVQYEINNSLHSTIGTPPYNVLFGEPKTALNVKNLPTSVFPNLAAETEIIIEPKEEPTEKTPGQSSDDDC